MTGPAPVSAGQGGKRPGAGRPPGSKNSSHAERFAKARADKEEQAARLKALDVQAKAADLKERVGDLVRRGDVERRFSSYVTIVVQMLETLPDILERDGGISGEAVERVQSLVDKVRADLHEQLTKHFT